MRKWLLIALIEVAAAGCSTCFIDAIPELSSEPGVAFDCDPSIRQ